MDQLYNDIARECKFAAPGARFSFSVRNRLEKYKKRARRDIVSRSRDNCAPLFLAAKRGNVEIVEYLITICDANVEQRGIYEMSHDRSVHCATPLWCAAVSGKLGVVKCLINHGADVDATSDSGSTAVRSACYMTHLDVVEYLVEHGADILKPNFNGGTCLINSVQSVELCTFLLRHGADVNAGDIQNKTPLHYAIHEHRFETTKLLLDNNANPRAKSSHGEDALQTACLKGAIQIFDYLVEKISYSQERLADANELMGSTFFDEHNDTQTALEYWRRAMAIRNANTVDGNPLPKRPVMPTRDSFRNATEYKTLDELNAIALDPDAIRIQSLLICERTLGEHHKDTVYRLMYRGATYMDALRYQRCIDLWRRALEIRVVTHSILCTDTCFAAQALVRIMLDVHEQMLHQLGDGNREKEGPRFSDVVAVFKLLSSEFDGAQGLPEKRPVNKQKRESYDEILKCVAHLIHLLMKTARSNAEEAEARRLIHNLVKINPRSASNGDTLLHLCVSRLNTINSIYFTADDAQIQHPTIFPHIGVVGMLLECGASVNARNDSRSTPLHVASRAYNFVNPVIELLLEHGAHLDSPNEAGDSPAVLISQNRDNAVNLLRYMTLRCHAAQTIISHGIPFHDLPTTLHRFVESHR